SLMKKIRHFSKYLCCALLAALLLNTAKAQSIDFDQVKNGKGDAAGTIIEFIGSELGPNNSTYSEGMSVPQRVQLRNLTGTSHVFSFRHQIYDPTKSAFAYDFL